MIEIQFARKRDENERRYPARDGAWPCFICGKPIRPDAEHYMIHVHKGGSHVVTEEEAAALNEAGEEAADMGGHRIGAMCLRLRPYLRPYAVESDKVCGWCGNIFNGTGDRCGKCREEREANRIHNEGRT